MKVSSVLSELDIKEAVLSALMPLMKDAVEKVLWKSRLSLQKKC